MSNNKLFNQLVSILSASYEETDNVVNFIDNVKAKKAVILSIFRDSKSSKKKDPNSPKKWRTSYIFFCSEHREKLKTEEPTLTTTQIVSRLAAIWRNLNNEDKQKYEKMALEDKKRYEEEIKQYNPENPETENSSSPKRPLTSYLYFCNETRDAIKKEFPVFSGKQITTELGKRWKQLSDEEKKPFVEKQKLDRERYDNEKSKHSPNETKRKEKPVKETKKHFVVTPGFKIFEQEQNEFLEEEHSEWSLKKIQSEILNNWNKLSKEEKEEYEVEATENIEEQEELLDD